MHLHHESSRSATFLIHRIERYRSSPVGGHNVCRFTPSCSRYAEEALQTRRLPLAVLLIAWRLLRCNPFAQRRVADPVMRSRRWRLRPNALPTVLSILALSGFIVVVTAGIAEAVGVTGGCLVKVNGDDPTELTADHPLVVHKGDGVGFIGTVPRSALGSGAGQIESTTHIKVEVIDKIAGVTSSDHPGHGAFWGHTVDVDKYLKYGGGLYHVIGHATGTGGWTCDGDVFVRLDDGNPLTSPIGGGAAGVALVGLFGSAYASRAPKPNEGYAPDPPPDPDADKPLITAGDLPVETQDSERLGTKMVRDNQDEFSAALGCLLLVMLIVGLAFIGKDAAASAGALRLGSPGHRRIWSHGHPIVGFISGLLLGIGITVLLQQYAVWPLTIVTAIAFPVVVAIVVALRAYLGTPYRVVRR